jgi:cellulose synthase/poly-beta-1,6-N-acetylglucosamine synthase-like glycosyltransferase
VRKGGEGRVNAGVKVEQGFAARRRATRSPVSSDRSALIVGAVLGDDVRDPLWWWLVPITLVALSTAWLDVSTHPIGAVPEWLSTGMAAFAAAHLVAVVTLPVMARRADRSAQFVQLALVCMATAVCTRWVGAPVLTVIAWSIAVTAVWSVGAWNDDVYSPGIHVFSTHVALVVVSSAWGAWFLLSLRLSALTTVLLWVAATYTAVSLPSSLVQSYEGWERLLRRRWTRARDPIETQAGDAPVVMIHVPVHAEPPDVVIATLDALAALDYERFSVLVVDNNTDDESLWRPVEAHCSRLGGRFGFVHLMGVRGAKAGALNAALQLTPASVQLVGVVDADYQVRPDWLTNTVGHFADPGIGFVQCPHAYRDFGSSRFGRMANAEYTVFFETSMVSYNERDAALTVGTMSLIRRDVLDHVGGWAEWCLTEDSELSLRVHSAGYGSVYLTEPMGRGLIPETFAAYRRQRFRWTYGPVQELRAHLDLFLPSRRRRLTLGQLVHHGNHGLDVALISVRFLTIPITALAAVSMVAHDEVIRVPLALWITATAMVLSSILMRFAVLRQVLGSSLRLALGSVLAYFSLTYVIQTASLRALFGLPATWDRTDKFGARRHRRSALRSARAETVTGLAALGVAIVGLVTLPESGVAMMLLLGIAMVGLIYLTSPVVALIADHDLARRTSSRASDVSTQLASHQLPITPAPLSNRSGETR